MNRTTSLPQRASLALCGLLLAPLAAASDIRVSKTSDSLDGACDADCSLREAVVLANSLPGGQRILLRAGVYQLSLPPERGDPEHDEEDVRLDEDDNRNGDLDIHDPLEIVGAGIGRTVIDASRTDRILEVFAGASLGLRGMTLRNGYSSFYGGAIANEGVARVNQVRFESNAYYHPFGGGRKQGGAIANYGMLEVFNAQFVNNSATGGDSTTGDGGAIHNSATLLVRDSLFQGNVSINDDDSSGSGGAIDNLGQADIARSAFVDNYAAVGGAILNKDNGVLKLSNSTLAGNRSAWDNYSGILQNGGTFSAGIPELRLIHVTIANNRNYGLVNHGQVLIRNSLISANRHSSDDSDVNCSNRGLTYQYQARGLLLGNGAGNCTADLYVENAETFAAVLQPLADNGGQTPTFALRPDSPALDTAVGSCASHDQRRSSRPRDGNGDGVAACDLGAFEH